VLPGHDSCRKTICLEPLVWHRSHWPGRCHLGPLGSSSSQHRRTPEMIL
jgi:hypothetical protein